MGLLVEARSLPGTESASLPPTDAWLTMFAVAAAEMSNVTMQVAIAPSARLPTVQVKVPAPGTIAQGAVATGLLREAGKVSVTVTPVASPGPLLVTLSV